MLQETSFFSCRIKPIIIKFI